MSPSPIHQFIYCDCLNDLFELKIFCFYHAFFFLNFYLLRNHRTQTMASVHCRLLEMTEKRKLSKEICLPKGSKKELGAPLVLKEGSRGTLSCPVSVSGPVSELEEGASGPLRLDCLATPH